MKNTLTFRPNISNLKKFWIRKEIKDNRIIESGSFNDELYKGSYKMDDDTTERWESIMDYVQDEALAHGA